MKLAHTRIGTDFLTTMFPAAMGIPTFIIAFFDIAGYKSTDGNQKAWYCEQHWLQNMHHTFLPIGTCLCVKLYGTK